ncbi:hypothetical protein CWN83_13430 [Vibrio splendidus]|nr:hypothetical protein CWN83_13430 [Vibrio splendidus]
MAFLDALVIAFITGGVSSLGTIAALKTDINWIKRVQQDQEQRIRKLEGSNERTQVHRPRPNGQIKQGYTLKNGRVVRRIQRGNATKNADSSNQSKGLFSSESRSFCISFIRV